MSYALCNLTPFKIHITFWCLKTTYQVLNKNVLTGLLDLPIKEWKGSQGNTTELQKPGKWWQNRKRYQNFSLSSLPIQPTAIHSWNHRPYWDDTPKCQYSWLPCDACSGTHNMHWEYQDLITASIVTQCYGDMGAWHHTCTHITQIMKVGEITASKCCWPAVKQFHNSKTMFPLPCQVICWQHKPCFTTKWPNTFFQMQDLPAP